MDILQITWKIITSLTHMIIIHYVLVNEELKIGEIINTTIKLSIIAFILGGLEAILEFIRRICLGIYREV